MSMISFQKLTEQGRRSDGTLKNLGKDCRGGYSWQLPQAINKYRPLHLTFLSNLSSLPMKTTGYVLAFFHHGKFCRKPTGQNIAGSFFESSNSTSVSQRRQHSNERDVDSHVDIGCLKNGKIFYDQGRQIHIEICRILWNFCLADSMSNEKYYPPSDFGTATSL